MVWPTRSVVSAVEPGRMVAWDTKSSGARWIWELTPEGDGHPGGAPPAGARGLTPLGNVFAKAFLGGVGGHADELEEGMAQSVPRLKQAVENRGRSLTPAFICPERTSRDTPWNCPRPGYGQQRDCSDFRAA